MGLICTCKGEYSNGECIPCPDGTVYTWYGQCVACPNGQIEVDGVCKHGTHNKINQLSLARPRISSIKKSVARPRTTII